MTARKQLSMVLPEPLIAAIKRRAASQGQSITAYISRLVEQDLAAAGQSDASPPLTTVLQRLQQLEQRLATLEQQTL